MRSALGQRRVETGDRMTSLQLAKRILIQLNRAVKLHDRLNVFGVN